MIGQAQAYADDQTSALQQQINEVLASTQGGVQISPNEIAWENGNVIMSFPEPGETEAPASSPVAANLEARVSAPAGASSAEIAEAADAIVADSGASDVADEGSDDAPSGVVSAAASDSSCPTVTFGNDWYCFYQYTNYGGRRLQFSAAYSTANAIMFDAYGFENKTSSWSNKGGKTIYVGGRTVSGNNYSCNHWVNGKSPRLWTEGDHSHSPSVGSLDNQADCFWTS
ncbi:peptidase inhibitor family I36 protein [Streptomyces sp. NPDC085995]|uniref:peptidase inhibitor family I36 protein n=1 Tax=Streptomyces sp. NPDC085995 TaxID=3154861 RepID=UPI00343793A5